jgi:hypothetical protein
MSDATVMLTVINAGEEGLRDVEHPLSGRFEIS